MKYALMKQTRITTVVKHIDQVTPMVQPGGEFLLIKIHVYQHNKMSLFTGVPI